MQLGLELLIDHGTNEVIEAEIVFLLAGFVEGRLGIRRALELRLKTKAVLIKKGTLLIGSRVREFIGRDEGCSTLSRFSKMLKMSKFCATRRVLLVVPFVALQVHLRLTFFGKSAVGAVQVFFARNEFVVDVQCARCKVNTC